MTGVPEQEDGGEDIGQVVNDIVKAAAIKPGECFLYMKAVEVAGKEFDVLELLMRHPRQVVTRGQFYDRIWGYDFGGESNILEVYIRYLRQKLEKVGAGGLIHTVRGVGYMLRDVEDDRG